MIDYCTDQRTTGEKITDFFDKLLGIENIDNACDLARVVEKYSSEKEKETNGISISRGLVVSTLLWLYNGRLDIDDTTSDDFLDSSSPNDVLVNIASSGLISAKDIEVIVDNMVFEVEYTEYQWNQEEEKECEYDEETGEEIKCHTTVTYSCKPTKVSTAYNSSEKYKMFLRYGSSFEYETDNNGKSIARWNLAEVNDGLIKIKNKNISLDGKVDPVISFQEITNYNEAYSITSDECKIPGKAEEVIPENTEDITHVRDSSIDTALNAFPYEIIDTMAFDYDEKDVDENESTTMIVSSSNGCKLNNIKMGDNLCNLTVGELNYKNGFIFNSFPQFKPELDEQGTSISDITGEEYDKLVKRIEHNVENIDTQEEYLNEIFGFGPGISGNTNFYSGIIGNGTYLSGASCLMQDNAKIRLRTCSCSTNKAQMAKNFAGGASYVNGTYIANNTISMDDYIKGVARAEAESLFYNSKIEALKFQLIAIKSYALSKMGDISGGEITVDVGSCCAQNYKTLDTLDSRYKSVLEAAYNEVKNVLLYNKNGEILRAEYRSGSTKELERLAENGLKYTEMLNNDVINKYADYKNSTFNTCSTTSVTGNNFVQNAASFLGWNNMRFINSQYQSTSDYRSGSPWCARFVNTIKEITPGAKEKIGYVSGQAGVKYWMRHFASTNGLTFYASNRYSTVGYYKSGVRYLYSGSVYVPKAGDLIFYAYQSEAPWNGNPLDSANQDHVAIVAKVYQSGSKICIDTIEGNVGGNGNSNASSVKYFTCTYHTGHASIAGFGAWE